MTQDTAHADARLPALSVDELRVLLRLAGATALPLESDRENGLATDVADAVAARSLLARGLAEIAGEQLQVAPRARAAVTPAMPADRLVQLDVEVEGDLHRHLFVEGNGRALQLREREPDVWLLDPVSGRDAPATTDIVDEAVLDLVQAHAAGSSAEPTATRLDLDAHTHLRVDAAAIDGATADVVQLLRSAKVDDVTAARWATALTQRHGAGAVRVALRAGPGSEPALTGEGVGWVAAGAHGLWRVVEHAEGATIATIDLATLRADVRRALAGALWSPA